MTLRWWYIMKIIMIDKSVAKNKKWFPNLFQKRFPNLFQKMISNLFQMTPRTGKTESWRLVARRSLRTRPTRTTQNTWQVEQKVFFVCFFFFSKIRAQTWSFNFDFRKENPCGGNPGPRPIRSQAVGRLCSVSNLYLVILFYISLLGEWNINFLASGNQFWLMHNVVPLLIKI